MHGANNKIRVAYLTPALRAEGRALIALGMPMALTQLIQFSVNTIDVLMIGRLGAEPLAASSLGLVFFFAAWLVGYGPAMAVSPMISQALGAKGNDHDYVRRSVRMGLWGLALMTPFVGLFFVNAGAIAGFLGQPEHLADMAGPYILALLPGWPFALAIFILRNFLAALGLTRAPLVVIIGTTALNAGLNWLLIYGNLGFPQLGLVGAGIASSAANMTGFFVLALYCRIHEKPRAFAVFRDIFKPDWRVGREVFRLGWPIGVTTAFEGFLFNACVLLMGRIGVSEMAAFQVALNVAALAFMGPLGMSMAGAVRVGLHAGAGDEDGVRRAAFLTVLICALMMCFAAALVLAAPMAVAGLYLQTDDPENILVIDLVVKFMTIAAAFMLFDGIQVAANQALRGLKDVHAPMLITGVSYWLVGFPLAAWLGLASPLGASGVWWGLLASLSTAALLLSVRLYQQTRSQKTRHQQIQ